VSGIAVEVARDGLRLGIRVSAKASRDAVLGAYGDRLKVAVRAAPTRGKANRSVVRLLETALDLPRGSIEITAGAGSSSKTLFIRGVSRDTLLERIGRLIRDAGEDTA